jgi:putative tricarboxylic transport membrane protein
MDIIGNLAFGFGVALSFENVLFALIGALIGTAIGVLPGIGPVATISLLLPITFGQPATTAIIMLAGIYYGA